MHFCGLKKYTYKIFDAEYRQKRANINAIVFKFNEKQNENILRCVERGMKENRPKKKIELVSGRVAVLCCISTCVDISQERTQFPIE